MVELVHSFVYFQRLYKLLSYFVTFTHQVFNNEKNNETNNPKKLSARLSEFTFLLSDINREFCIIFKIKIEYFNKTIELEFICLQKTFVDTIASVRCVSPDKRVRRDDVSGISICPWLCVLRD